MLLDRQNKVLGQRTLFQGGLSSMAVDPKIVFAVALKSLASQVIIAHNHPSGNLKASNQDIALTKKLVRIGELHDLPVIDHLIVTDEGYYSFSNEGMMPS
ncbi:MAG: JAB domain-containing protein [Cyclobacteriaceae bacterium]